MTRAAWVGWIVLAQPLFDRVNTSGPAHPELLTTATNNSLPTRHVSRPLTLSP